ncbi:MAG: hypothetical protein ACE5JX_17155 [Acidobacteriota bacterium]
MRICITGCLLALMALPLLARQRDVDIFVRNPTETRLAVGEFVPRDEAEEETLSALKVFNQVLWNDLEFSAFFQMPSKSFYPLKSIRLPLDLEFESWQTPALDVDFLAFGNLQVYEAAVVVEGYLYDLKTRQQVIGKRYTIGTSDLVRRVAHQFSDEIVYKLSAGASRGVAQTRIAFSSRRGDSTEVYVTDYDGSGIRTITANGGLNKFPAWSPDNTKLAFVTKLPKRHRWELWIQDLAGGRVVVSAPSSYVSSPALFGSQLVYASRAASALDSDIFLSALDGSGRRNLSNHQGIDTSPTFSPTGQQIAFVSDRSGTPQLWVMDSDGSNVRRLVFEGGHCDSPAWSPDGRFILYSWQAPGQWTHDVYVAEVATGRIYQLTSGRGSNENPAWSPDGRHVVFQSDRTGTKQIFIMNADGKNLKQITAYGSNDSPAWSFNPTPEINSN